MLEEIRIGAARRHRLLDPRARPGLTVITGETGAGKTMVVTALGLLLGRPRRQRRGAHRRPRRPGRGRRGRDRPRRVRRAAVDEAGGEVEDGRVVLARNVSAEGRSRAFVGGASVPVTRLAEVAEPLVAVHGQSDQHRLLQPRRPARGARPVRRRAAAPRLAGGVRRPLRAGSRPPSASSTRWSTSARERAREADLLRFGLGEIEAVGPAAGRGRRAGGRGGPAGLRRHPAHRRRAGPRGAVRRGRRPRRARRRPRRPAPLLDGVREHDAEAGELADRLAEITYLLSDVAADVASYAVPRGHRPGPAGRGLRAAGGADRADPEVRRDHRRGARLGARPRRPGCSTSTAPTSGSRRLRAEQERCAPSSPTSPQALSAARAEAAAPARRPRSPRAGAAAAHARPIASRRRRLRRSPRAAGAGPRLRPPPASTRSSSCSPPTSAPSRGRCTRAPRAASCPG